MNNFPSIAEPHVALLRSDGNTGHVLTIEGTVYFSDDKQVYMVFENLAKAKEYVAERQFIDDEIEYTIFDHKQVLIEFIAAAKWGK